MEAIVRGISLARFPDAQKKILLTKVLHANRPGSKDEAWKLLNNSVNWLKTGADIDVELAGILLRALAKQVSAEVVEFFETNHIAQLLSTPGEELSFVRKMRCLRLLLSVREEARAGSTATDCSQLALMVKDWIMDVSLESAKKIELARLMTESPLCRPSGVDLINTCVVWLASIPLEEATFDAASAAISSLLPQLWTDDMQRVMWALQRTFAIVSSTVANPSPALSRVLELTPSDFIGFATTEVAALATVTDQQMLLALQRLGEWPLTPSISAWLVGLLKGLATARRYTVLAQTAGPIAEVTARQLLHPLLRNSALSVLEYVLLGFQESPSPFHQLCKRLLPFVLHQLADEATATPAASTDVALNATGGIDIATLQQLRLLHINESNAALVRSTCKPHSAEAVTAAVHRLSDLCYSLMFRHPGFPELYEPLLRALAPPAPDAASPIAVVPVHFPAPAEAQMRQRLLEAHWRNLDESMISPELRPRSNTTNLAGLVNLGNTCYMNCFIQALYMTEEFRMGLMHFRKSARGQQLAEELQRAFAHMILTQRNAFKLKRLQAVLPAQYRTTQQQDTSEFARYLFDALETDLKDSPLRDLVNAQFGGRLLSTVKCTHCGSMSSREETFLDLTLAFPAAVSDGSHEELTLEQMVSYFLRAEVLTDKEKYSCESCGTLRDAQKMTRITRPPEHLMLTLSRFEYDFKTNRRLKILRQVSYPLEFQLPVQEVGEGGLFVERMCDYVLYAVVMHSGMSADHGHYYTYARFSGAASIESNGHASVTPTSGMVEAHKRARWVQFNDTVTEWSEFEKFSSITKRGFHTDVPYVLFYKRKAHALNPLPTVNIEEVPATLRDEVQHDNRVFIEEQEKELRRQRAPAPMSYIRSSNNNFRPDDPDGGSRFCRDDFGYGGGSGGGGGMNFNRHIF